MPGETAIAIVGAPKEERDTGGVTTEFPYLNELARALGGASGSPVPVLREGLLAVPRDHYVVYGRSHSCLDEELVGVAQARELAARVVILGLPLFSKEATEELHRKGCAAGVASFHYHDWGTGFARNADLYGLAAVFDLMGVDHGDTVDTGPYSVASGDEDETLPEFITRYLSAYDQIRTREPSK